MKNSPWSRLRDSALVLAAGGGAVVSLATQQAAIASIPVTALVAMGLLDRRRLERRITLLKTRNIRFEGHVAQAIHQLHSKVSALPTPETLTNMHRAAMAHSDGAVMRFSQRLEQTQQTLEEKIQTIRQPDLSHLYQDMAQLQDQYTYVCSTLDNLDHQVQRLASRPRMEATEVDVSHLKTELMQLRVNLETLGSESKTAQATLQDAVRHLDRRLRQAPAAGDSNLLKGEVRELVKAVADLVPRRELNTFTEKLRVVEGGQDNLRRQLEAVKAQGGVVLNGNLPPGNGAIQKLENQIKHLSNQLEQLEKRLSDMGAPFDITTEIRGTTATYLSGMQWQLSALEQATQELVQRQQGLQLPPGQAAATPGGEGFSIGVDTEAGTGHQWLTTLQGGDTHSGAPSTVDQALWAAIAQAQQQLVLVWPWSATTQLDQALVNRFQHLLERQCHLALGWCHGGDRQEGILLRTIIHGWHLAQAERQYLKGALNQLLALKQRYPDHFKFTVLGTDEQFLVCDRDYAIIGLGELPTASRAFPALDMRLRVTDGAVIDQLLHRFEDATPDLKDDTAYFNRAVTRYDLRDLAGAIADYGQVLCVTPNDPVALNNRGVAWCDRQQPKRALEDFDHALALDGQQFVARCNRGGLHLTLGNPTQALVDLTKAIELKPTVAFAHFYCGQAHQKLGNPEEAIAAYTMALQYEQQIALPYCFRGAVYQQQGETQRAIADWESAASLLHAQRDHRTLAQITEALTLLKRKTVIQPLGLHTPKKLPA